MSLRIETNAEPIPGYRLIERLGSGGFGEVWKAEAPGGLFKAIKFVQRGSSKDDSSAIDQTDPERSRADQELKSLSRVKTVHHPYVISLDRFEVVDDCLVIVMELADRTLSDRFKQCRSQGMPGVPRDELLNYLEEAAEALDLMNSLYQLQHLDIKPQNLFLVHNHVKVADFGLVKDVTDQKFMTITGGVTPVYAAPETFDGKFSRQSDQYSLAIVYQEILTGQRPFTGTSMKQLILQHLQNAHDLTPLPVHDRPIVARALSKNPEDRFATCLELVEALRRITGRNRLIEASGGVLGPTGAPMPSERTSVSKTVGVRGAAGPVHPVDPNFSVGKAQLAVGAGPRPADAKPSLPLPRSGLIGKPSIKQATAMRRKSPTRRAAEQQMAGIVQPALVVGMGQLGIETLAELRKRIATDLGLPQALPHVRMLAIDTEPEVMNQAIAGNDGALLRTQETFLARLQRPSQYLKTRDGKMPTDAWLNPRLLYRIPREQTGAGVRALGRLAFVDNYRPLAKRLEAELHALCSQDTPHDSAPECELGLRTNRPRVYVVASLTGNTGSGMFVDVAYLLRRLLNEQGHADAEVVGIFYLPRVRREAFVAGPLANAHASLVELQHYCKPDAVFSAQYETAGSTTKPEKVNLTGPALQRCIFLPLAEPEGKLAEVNNAAVVAQAGDFLYRDLATALGQTFDQERQTVLQRNADHDDARGPVLESIGACRIQWPRHALLGQAGRKLCSQLVTRWMQKDASALADTIQQWTAESWESLGLRPEDLIERFKQMAEHALQQGPEGLLSEILGPARDELTVPVKESAKGKTQLNLSPIIQTMDRLERVLGIPEEVRSARQIHSEPALFERSFAEIALVIADECEQKLAELAVSLLEDPNYRLAGAEEALRQFAKTVDQALQSQETLAKELADKAAQLNVRIQQWIDRPLSANAPTSTHWSFGLARRPNSAAAGSPADLFELLRTYTKTRFHSLILAHLNRLYVGLRGHLSDQIREVGFCRQRLGELLRLLQPAAFLAPQQAGAATAGSAERALFPPGCVDLPSAVEQLIQSVTFEDLVCFDVRMQEWIQTHCQALLQVCMGSSSTVKNLVPAMLHEAEIFLGERLQGASVAEMYLTGQRALHGDAAPDMIADDLQRCLDEATPAFGRIRDGNEVTIVSFPNCAEGLELKAILQERFKDGKILLTDAQDEMLFFHDIVSMQWKDLDQLGPIAAEIYQARCAADPSSLHTREDVFDWQLILANKTPG